MVYDLIVLGGGPAGYLASERAGHAGMNVLLIEKKSVGGVCLNEGCVPTKSLLYSAKLFDYANHGDKYGVTVTGASIDHAKVVERKNKVVKTLVSGVKAALKANKVTVIDAEGVIQARSEEGYVVKANGEAYTGKRLLIATGSEAVVPPIPGLKEGLASGFVMTNREILDMKEVPKKLVVIGGGVIGLEMVSYFNSIGTEVVVVEMLPNIAGQTDKDIRSILQKTYEKKGVKFLLSAKVTAVKAGEVVFEAGEKPMSETADKVLLSIGRRASTAGIGLENIGVLMERGAIVTDRYMKTNLPEVYAAGDVNGKSMLAHTAYREAEVAVSHMLGKKDHMRYNAIPAVIYTNPEAASVGVTEEQAKQEGLDAAVVNTTMRYSGRYVAENEGGDGICKLIIDKRYNTLIGAQAIGNYSSEFIVAAGILIEAELTVDEIKQIVFPHPTVCEILREAIFQY